MVTDRPLSSFVEAVRARRPVTFSRWGDGEWHAVFGRTRGRNCDGHRFFPALGADLRRLLLSRPAYTLGLQPLARRLFAGQVEAWLCRHGLDNLDWVDADVFHTASRDGVFTPLLDALRGGDLVLVGPPHLERLRKFLGYRDFVAVPPRDSYLTWPDVLSKTLAVAGRCPAGGVVSVSAGMPAKLLVAGLHDGLRGRLSVIDFGSVFDPYAGVRSRKYMGGLDVEVRDG